MNTLTGVIVGGFGLVFACILFCLVIYALMIGEFLVAMIAALILVPLLTAVNAAWMEEP